MGNGDFERYLNHTTIYSYRDDTWKRRWSDYSKTIKDFDLWMFYKLIDNIIKQHKINNQWNIFKNINEIGNHIIEELWKEDFKKIELEKDEKTKKELHNKLNNKLDIIKNVFININWFLKKVIWIKIDEYWLVPNYDNTDARIVYNAMWSDWIDKLFWENEYIKRIRQTRNKFIEHYEEYKDKSKTKCRRRVILKWIWDNIRWEIKMDLMDKNGKEYRISICPLFDFCIFINELTQIKTTPPSLVI